MCLPFSHLTEISNVITNKQTEKLLSLTFQPNIHWCQQTVRHKLQLKKKIPWKGVTTLEIPYRKILKKNENVPQTDNLTELPFCFPQIIINLFN